VTRITVAYTHIRFGEQQGGLHAMWSSTHYTLHVASATSRTVVKNTCNLMCSRMIISLRTLDELQCAWTKLGLHSLYTTRISHNESINPEATFCCISRPKPNESASSVHISFHTHNFISPQMW